jgi:hypothetical protein
MKMQEIVAGESVSRIPKNLAQTRNLRRINPKIYVYNLCGRVFVRDVFPTVMFLSCSANQ